MNIVNPVTNVYFHFFEALAFEVEFFRASFLHHITDTESMLGHAAQIFLKWTH